MKKNIGNFDRVIRIAVALFIALLVFSQPLSGGWGILLSVVGGYFFLTGVAGDCLLYWMLGINTCGVKYMKGSH